MPAAGMTGELYSQADDPTSTLGAPPSAPVDVPPPTKVVVTQPVTTKARMADETPDGRIRDTSSEALRPGNDLNFRNISDEEIKKPEPAAEPAKETPPVEKKPPELAKEPVPEKIYAGKFKTPEDLEKGYLEAEKAMRSAQQKAAELSRQPPAPPPQKTPEQLAAEQAEANNVLNQFVADPKGFLEKRDQRLIQNTMVALTAQQVAESWRKANPDLAEHEVRVAFEATLLAQSDPELAGDHAALLSRATDNFRKFTGKIRTEGAKEALTQETRTIPLLNGSSTPAATEQPAKAPLTQDASFEMHLKMLKEQEQRSHRGLRR